MWQVLNSGCSSQVPACFAVTMAITRQAVMVPPLLEAVRRTIFGVLDYMTGADLLPPSRTVSSMAQHRQPSGSTASEGSGLPARLPVLETHEVSAPRPQQKARRALRRKKKVVVVQPLSVTVLPLQPQAQADVPAGQPEHEPLSSWETDDSMWVHSGEEMAAISALRAELGGEKLATAGARAMFHAFGGEPRCLMRYLKLSKLDAHKAATALCATLNFRQENSVDGLQLPPELLARILPHWCCAYGPNTPDGSPTLYWKLSALDAGAMFASGTGVTQEEFTQFFCYWMELGLSKQRASLASGLKPAGVLEIYDLGGVSLSQMMSSGTRTFGSVLGLGQQHYPENLKCGYLIVSAIWRMHPSASSIANLTYCGE
jgi:hypothetical protein